MFRKVLQEKMAVKKLPLRQAVTESLNCIDAKYLDEYDEFESRLYVCYKTECLIDDFPLPRW